MTSDQCFGYRFGFNGYEREDDIAGQGSVIDFGMRVYDARLGRFFSVDPISYEYWSPYQYDANSPISNKDILGMGNGDPDKHKVKDGETMSGIANGHDGVSLKDLISANPQVKNPDLIYPGQELNIPLSSSSGNPSDKESSSSTITPVDIVDDRGKVVATGNVNNALILISPTLTITSVTVDGVNAANDWNELNAMLKSGKFQVNYKGAPRIHSLQYWGNTAESAKVMKEGKAAFSIQAANNVKIGKGLSATSYGLVGLGYVMIPLQWKYDPDYGKGFGGKANEATADAVMNTASLNFPYGTAAAVMYNFRVKPMLKAETYSDKYGATSSPRSGVLLDKSKMSKQDQILYFGNGKKNPNVGGYSSGFGRSDSTLKASIVRVDSSFGSLLDLGVYYYGWKDSSYSNFGVKEYGLLAQEVQNQFPELVKTDSNGHLTVGYYQMIPLLLQGMKDQQKMLEEQSEQIINLRKSLEFLMELQKIDHNDNN
jgi:RHS repeat-associated protein